MLGQNWFLTKFMMYNYIVLTSNNFKEKYFHEIER